MNSNYDFRFLKGGGQMGEFARKFDWSDSPIGTPNHWPKSLCTLVQMMLSARVPMLICWGPELVTLYNDAFQAYLGSGEEKSWFGRSLDKNTEFWTSLGSVVSSVMAGSDAVNLPDQDLHLAAHSGSERIGLKCSVSPLMDDNYSVNGVLITCLPDGSAVGTRQLQHSDLEKSTARLRNLVESAPFPIGVYVGREMRIELVNQAIIDVWGKGNDIIGNCYAEILPELAGTGIYEQLDSVYTTGKAYEAKNQRVDLMIDGHLKLFYFNYTFTPLRDSDGRIYGVMNTAADVTDLVVIQQDLRHAEASLRGAIELAELGSWELDIPTGKVTYSRNIQNWFGFGDQQIPLDQIYEPIHPQDRDRVNSAIAQALLPGSDGIYDAEYRLIAYKSDVQRIVHARGKVIYDNQGVAYKLVGSAQDVTAERQQQQQLESLVELRTKELAAANEELAAQNEEYIAINEELEKANQLFIRSNENLQQFAYVASHDLQEPLRKIQQFGDLLHRQYGAEIGNGLNYLERMRAAASRMSTLIEDLLSFSSLTSQGSDNQEISLQAIIKGILPDFELTILETGAIVQIDELPVIYGNRLQLGQLFQNLLSNALKFRHANVAPMVQIKSAKLSSTDLPPSVKPARRTDFYYQIEVTDNGIGFDEQYQERIFQVFQRLHGKNEFAGTGIGLAICAKVMENHGGAIMATSRRGHGASFKLYFPVIGHA
ncbi:ATP-binding protein [Dyadobacter sp. CY351]|nr:ATP-binding protein [Dyadobacter sp. CY351]